MKSAETSICSAYRYLGEMFDWAADIERFQRELDSGAISGRCDPLLMAEMECSIDVMDAELVGLKRGSRSRELDASLNSLLVARNRLERLIVMARKLVGG
jgi:hypothetical protein